MFVRNLLKSGDFAVPIPAGLLLTLQYDAKGKLQKIYQGYHEHTRINITDKVLKSIQDARIVPVSIPLQGGTTWVTGVLYSCDRIYDPGSLPDCISDTLLSRFVSEPSSCRFYAGTVSSLAASFQGRPAIQTWLQIAKFEPMYGFVVPYKFDKATLLSILSGAKTRYDLSVVTGYIIFRNGDVTCKTANASQFIVTRVVKYLKPDGQLKARIYGKVDSENMPLVVDYSDVVTYNIQVGNCVVLDEQDRIAGVEVAKAKSKEVRSKSYQCTCCGATFEIPASGPVYCTNPDCVSVMYPRIVQLTNTLNLPLIPYETFSKYVDSKMILHLADIFLLPEYTECQVYVTWSKLLSAVVPVEIVPDTSLITVFTTKCKNEYKTIMYYLHSPKLIPDALNMKDPMLHKFIRWLEDPINVLTIESLTDSPNITLTATNRAFDGAPIFRNQVIYVTGRFNHGSLDEIYSILSSYGASVTTEYTDSVTWVLVGDIPENVHSAAVRKAKQAKIPVFFETQFFHDFEIDADLVNLGVENL